MHLEAGRGERSKRKFGQKKAGVEEGGRQRTALGTIALRKNAKVTKEGQKRRKEIRVGIIGERGRGRQDARLTTFYSKRKTKRGIVCRGGDDAGGGEGLIFN